MSSVAHAERPGLGEAAIQSKVAAAVTSVYKDVDLTIPAQRDVANGVREKLGYDPLRPLRGRKSERPVYQRVKSAGREAMYRVCVAPLKPEVVKAFTKFALGGPRIEGAVEPLDIDRAMSIAADLASGNDTGVNKRLLTEQPLVELIERRNNQIPFRDKEM